MISAFPRPNQAFWILSALWAGWLWGRSAVDPYRVALRRRRYDWSWSATALTAAFRHLFDLLALATPFFGLLPEVEPAFLTSAFLALNAAGFVLKGASIRTEHDPVQLLWERGEDLERDADDPDVDLLRSSIQETLAARAEPVRYIYLHASALLALTEAHALKKRREELDGAFRRTQSVIQNALSEDPRCVHFSSGEGVEAGLWGLREVPALESLPDRVEVALVSYLQKHPDAIYLEIEDDLYHEFPGLLTPSKGIMYAILASYAAKNGANWRLRPEDVASRRHADVKAMSALTETIGKRLGYRMHKQDHWLIWEEQGKPVRSFYTLASALVGRVVIANPDPSLPAVLVIPGGRASLIAYKQQRDPALAQRMQDYRVVKYRLWRLISELPILTRETFDEQLATDPVRKAEGQMMMF